MEVTLEDRVLLWETELSRLSEDGEQLRERTWKDTIPRDHQGDSTRPRFRRLRLLSSRSKATAMDFDMDEGF